jgi:peptide-methionine (S)-S-oxide reductase
MINHLSTPALEKIAFSGGCHWCTEAIFQAIRGVHQVDQGWLKPADEPEVEYEGVLLYFDSNIVHVTTLSEIHLHTHSCTSTHVFREKYKSAVYVFSNRQAETVHQLIAQIQPSFRAPIITQVVDFHHFRLNKDDYLNYYKKNPVKPFCQNYIQPKLKFMLDKYGSHLKDNVI